jgi:hypothetical protein
MSATNPAPRLAAHAECAPPADPVPLPVIGAGLSDTAYQLHAQTRLGRGALRMARLGIEPALVDEETAAAVCGLSLKLFHALCPVPGLRVGNKTLRPLDLVKEWSVRYWAEATGYSLEELGRDAKATGDEDWASCLPDGPQAEGGRHGIAH